VNRILVVWSGDEVPGSAESVEYVEY